MSLSTIRQLYYNATKGSIQKDLTAAIELFKSLSKDEDREKAAVFMDGLSQMRSEWGVRPSPAKTLKRSPKKSSRS
ncbi:MAG: hypothetical protein HQ485_16830 [Acidobacteria bacterium]|mgnify:CR=1 FL=1|jgi:hypothetical protein|nr:hypothetical protein [Acidobacteriota bacterium]